MIANITGRWCRNWSHNIEAGERVCKVERFLSNNGFKLCEHSPVRVSTDRLILDDTILMSTADQSILDLVTERINKTDMGYAGNLHRLIWDMRNLKPRSRRQTYFNLNFRDFYYPGEIESRYEREKSSGLPYDFVDLVARTIKPCSEVSFDYAPNSSYTDQQQLLFEWGNTNKLIVEVRTSNDDFGKEILKATRKKRVWDINGL